jgi:hypothetical protein
VTDALTTDATTAASSAAAPAASPSATQDAALVPLLQAAAAAENAAVYGYSLAGARLTAHERTIARGDYDVHRAQLQAVIGWLAGRSATAAPAAPIYALPTPVTDAGSARALLASLEEGTAAAYADVVAYATGSLQRAAALALQSAAVREARWRGHSVPFPGLLGRLGS